MSYAGRTEMVDPGMLECWHTGKGDVKSVMGDLRADH